MKTINKQIIPIILLTLMIILCVSPQSIAQKGSVIIQERTLDNFNAIDISNALELILSQGDVQSVKVETNEGLQEYLVTEVKNGVLYIYQVNKMKTPSKLKVYVTVKELNSLTTKGASEIETATVIKSEKLEISASGASELFLELDVNELVSDFSGATEVKMKGKANKHNITLSGASELEAGALETQIMNINASGASELEINVKEELTGSVSGVSSISYTNEPKVKNLNISGASEVKGKNDTTKISFGDKDIFIFDKHHPGKKKKCSEKFNGHWGGVELGVNTFLNKDYNFELPYNYDFLEQKVNKSVGVNLNIFEQNIKLYKNNFGITTGVGISWDNYRFAKDITLRNDTSVIWYRPEEIDFKKNKLTLFYINVPLIFEVQTHKFNNNFHFGVGGMFGYRLGTHTKQVYKINDNLFKPKVYDDFHLSPFRYGLTARIGWSFINLFANYSLSTFFESKEGPELYPLMIGVRLVNW